MRELAWILLYVWKINVGVMLIQQINIVETDAFLYVHSPIWLDETGQNCSIMIKVLK